MPRVLSYLLMLLMLGANAAIADPVGTHSHIGIEWDNNRPEQRQALDHFYRSLEQHQLNNSLDQQMLRQERIEQLRDMTPVQRQQQILDFTQQYQQRPPTPIPQP